MWIWNNFEGLILFPFNGKTCDAILACFRMILYRKMTCVEKLSFNTLFSFRIALHIGSTVYERRGNTKNIISNSAENFGAGDNNGTDKYADKFLNRKS